MTAVGFEPTQLALVELESTPLDHSGKLSCVAKKILLYSCWLQSRNFKMSGRRPEPRRDLCPSVRADVDDIRTRETYRQVWWLPNKNLASISGKVVEYTVAIDVTWVRFPAAQTRLRLSSQTKGRWCSGIRTHAGRPLSAQQVDGAAGDFSGHE